MIRPVLGRIPQFIGALLSIGLAGYLSLTQPGMCPYWLVADPTFLSAPVMEHGAEHAAHHHHDHDQNRHNFVATVGPATSHILQSVTAWLALLLAAALKFTLPENWLPPLGWQMLPPFPPPRF